MQHPAVRGQGVDVLSVEAEDMPQGPVAARQRVLPAEATGVALLALVERRLEALRPIALSSDHADPGAGAGAAVAAEEGARRRACRERQHPARRDARRAPPRTVIRPSGEITRRPGRRR